MTLVAAAGVAVLFGSGVYMLLGRDAIRAVMGLLLISNASNLFLMSVGLSRGAAPIHPIADGPVSDPLVQALTLTAIVIGFGTTALLLTLVYAVYGTTGSLDVESLVAAERETEAETGEPGT